MSCQHFPVIIVSFEICLAPVEKSDSAILRNAMGHRRQKGTYIQTYIEGGGDDLG